MSEIVFDENRLLMMVSVLHVHSTDLRNEALDLSANKLEERWKQILSTLYECYTYAQDHRIFLGPHKDELREIYENLHEVEKLVKQRKKRKIEVVDKIARGVFNIAGRIDDIFEIFGWKRVVRPITEAIYNIPKKVIELFSEKDDPIPLPESIFSYLPASTQVKPKVQSSPTQSKKNASDVIDVEWVDVDAKSESYAQKLLRQMHNRVDRRSSGEDI